MLHRRVEKYWTSYFCVRIFFLLFDVLVYSKLSSLGDTERYLMGTNKVGNFFTDSTYFMDTIGGLISKLTFGIELLSNLPFAILSFYCVKWTAEKLELRKILGANLLFLLISIPNFCIWTSILSKEFFGLVFSSILGVLFVNFFKGDYRLHWRDLLGAYLCLLFKPQYFPFILQGLVYIYLSRKYFRSANAKGIFAIFVVLCNALMIFAMQDLIDELAFGMYIHFDVAGTSTRQNIFLKSGDFFRNAPAGMFTAFFGPTLREMLRNPLHLIAGLESIAIIGIFCWLTFRAVWRLFRYGKLSPIPLFSIWITITGLLFIHYPFGIFNPGSAIRYRTNFLFFVIILLSYLYSYYKPKKVAHYENLVLR